MSPDEGKGAFSMRCIATLAKGTLENPSCFLPGPIVSISGSLDVTEIHRPHLGRSTQSDCVSRRGHPTREVAPDSSPERRLSSAVSQHFASRYTYHVSVQASYRRLHATVEGRRCIQAEFR